MSYKSIANLAVDMQALHLLNSTLPNKKKKKKKVGRMAIDVIVGTSLLKVSAANASSL